MAAISRLARSPVLRGASALVLVALIAARPARVDASFTALLTQTVQYVNILIDEWEKHSRILEDHLDRVTGVMQPFSDLHAGVRELTNTSRLRGVLNLARGYRAALTDPDCYRSYPVAARLRAALRLRAPGAALDLLQRPLHHRERPLYGAAARGRGVRPGLLRPGHAALQLRQPVSGRGDSPHPHSDRGQHQPHPLEPPPGPGPDPPCALSQLRLPVHGRARHGRLPRRPHHRCRRQHGQRRRDLHGSDCGRRLPVGSRQRAHSARRGRSSVPGRGGHDSDRRDARAGRPGPLSSSRPTRRPTAGGCSPPSAPRRGAASSSGVVRPDSVVCRRTTRRCCTPRAGGGCGVRADVAARAAAQAAVSDESVLR